MEKPLKAKTAAGKYQQSEHPAKGKKPPQAQTAAGKYRQRLVPPKNEESAT